MKKIFIIDMVIMAVLIGGFLLYRTYVQNGGAGGDFDTAKLELCTNFLSGVIEPYKDSKTFVDDKYTEAAMTSRDYWDNNKLPQQVLIFTSTGYECHPVPLEFDYPEQGGDELAQPQVKTVEWTCVLKYDSWKYVRVEDVAQKGSLEMRGFLCREEACKDEEGKASGVFLCVK